MQTKCELHLPRLLVLMALLYY